MEGGGHFMSRLLVRYVGQDFLKIYWEPFMNPLVLVPRDDLLDNSK